MIHADVPLTPLRRPSAFAKTKTAGPSSPLTPKAREETMGIAAEEVPARLVPVGSS